ncbi:MAG: efflux RND transporter periplasmic adaptor subunit [Bradyrhizobium sp.]|uniref:efflux RND transporter periplasmic adaptor subunit n=1 Tax=Bradyrhizobium sp. TaxID=376 RepID=UPI00239F5E56|nr:efflux RND transporter periplasmic adaptor subunit [Bradyrhizobium sp.]MDE2066550.1 efflux RND transporter periplasmic adaptor subunit [Bradyrhizobium sp.]MDE2467788.1 efflux RND transporter periplasmic adaptor subunit [Bradyrhizobium sp.]
MAGAASPNLRKSAISLQASGATAPAVNAGQHRRLTIVILLAGFVVAITVVGFVVWQRSHSATSVRYVTSPASVGAVTRVVSTTGTVNPELTIIVGSYVSGVIKDVYCDYNTQVKIEQVCAKIDPRPYQTAVDQAKANLAVSKAQLQKDQAALLYAKVSYERNANLVKTHAVSLDAFDNAKSTYDQAQAQVAFDQAAIEQRRALLDAAQVNLDYTDIVSPVDGTVVSRNITIGQTVAASFQTPTLFLIASDLTKMQVDTNVSEGDIGEIKLGNKVQFLVDAFPNRAFEGKVTQIRQSPQTVQNVVTYDVVVGVGNTDLSLKPGMTASVRIITISAMMCFACQIRRYAIRPPTRSGRVPIIRTFGCCQAPSQSRSISSQD